MRILSSLGLGLAACVTASGSGFAADAIEGKWLGTAGGPENRAVFALEIRRDDQGALVGALTLDLLNCYGVALSSFAAMADGKFVVPEFGLELTLTGDRLAGTLSGDAAVELQRADHLPSEPPVPDDLPRGPEPRWQTKLAAPIWATVAVRDAVAYVGTQGGVFHAVKIADGSLTWTFSAGAPIFGEALVTGDAVYFGCDNGFLFKLERATGRELWRYDLGDAQVPRVLPHPAVYDYDHEAPAPVLADDLIYLGSGDGGFHAVRAATGERVWRFAAKGKIRGNAVARGPHVVFGTLDNFLHAVNRVTGREVWQRDTKGALTGSPAFIGDTLIVGTRGSMLVGLQPDSGATAWRMGFWGSWVESTAAPVGDFAVIGSSDLRRVTCFDPKSGRIVWRTDVYAFPER